MWFWRAQLLVRAICIQHVQSTISCSDITATKGPHSVYTAADCNTHEFTAAEDLAICPLQLAFTILKTLSQFSAQVPRRTLKQSP